MAVLKPHEPKLRSLEEATEIHEVARLFRARETIQGPFNDDARSRPDSLTYGIRIIDHGHDSPCHLLLNYFLFTSSRGFTKVWISLPLYPACFRYTLQAYTGMQRIGMR